MSIALLIANCLSLQVAWLDLGDFCLVFWINSKVVCLENTLQSTSVRLDPRVVLVDQSKLVMDGLATLFTKETQRKFPLLDEFDDMSLEHVELRWEGFRCKFSSVEGGEHLYVII